MVLHRLGLVFVSLVLCVNNGFFAQERIEPKWTLNADISLPFEIGNSFFSQAVDGLVNFQPYIQYSLPFHLHFGVGAKYQYFKINSVDIPSPRVGGVTALGGFANIGYDQFLTDRLALDFSVKVGYAVSQTRYSSAEEQITHRNKRNVFFVEPEIGLTLLVTENLGVKWLVGYGFQNFASRPQDFGFLSNEGHTENDLKKKTSYLQVGLGVVYYIGNKTDNE